MTKMRIKSSAAAAAAAPVAIDADRPAVSLTRVSTNVKTGPIPVSTTAAQTCPDSCPFNAGGSLADAGGCYAAGGPLAIHWRAISEGKRGKAWSEFLNDVKALPKGSLWRHNQAGDLPGAGDSLNVAAVAELAAANRGKRGFTYTHKPLDGAGELQAIADANAAGFAINLSANSPADADALAALGVAPVVTVLPIDYERRNAKGEWTETVAEYRERVADLPTHTPAGRRIAVCPAVTADTDCARCGACARIDRAAVIGFPAHGAGKKRAAARVVDFIRA
jgi:hypothetical protein